MELQERLKKLRLDRGWTQTDLANMSGCTQQTIHSYENGKRLPQGEFLVRIARALGVSSAYLMGLTDSPEREDRLPPDWEQAVEEAMAKGHKPGDVRRALAMLRLAMGVEDAPAGDR